ncbi:metallopeptidase family protein [Acuticoccus mangrovi]|uniref:Metallopeptidase family protein n=1 Tax=Acuticoccus mangrovi TaxID=2796142 RepID=A0A934IRV3_9HYPH|nr:metallopeptidase family protein [Acuticoccus mangrovi]MBJ3777515.1 metallopeptidase family protein [Acuticoccus mangrovi]
MVDIDAFTTIARAEYARLPEEFRSLTGDIVLMVAEEASPEVLRTMRIHNPLHLLGLFEGVGLAHAEATVATGQAPNYIWLYRRPILAYAADGENTVEEIIRHVLIHEIGHHFGLSDDDMYAIDDADD